MRRFLLALCALTLVVGGCGGGADGSLLTAAVRATEDAGGAEVAFELEIEVSGAPAVTMTGSGVEDAKNRRAAIAFDAPAPLGRMDVLQDGLTTYMRSDAFSGQFGGREWMKMNLEEVGSSMGVDMGQIPSVQTGSDQLRMLEEASDDLTEHGTETVRGTETTHYSAKVDVSRLPGGERIAEVSGIDEVPVDVWIDGDDRVRRVELDQEMSAAGVEMRLHMAVEYVRFGVPVEVTVPGDDEVIDVTDLAAAGAS